MSGGECTAGYVEITLSGVWNGTASEPRVEIRANRPCPGLVAGQARAFESHAAALAWARNQYGIDTAADLDIYGRAEMPA